MESSFKKGYEKNVNADGSFELSFKSRRLGPQASASIGALLAFAVLGVSCAATYPVASIFSPRSRYSSGVEINMFLWNGLAAVLMFALLYLILYGKTSILVKPNIGLVVGGKNLPFKDINQIGTIDHPSATNKKSAAFVYADTQGTQVQVSKYISRSLAEAIASEIKQASGITWK